MLGEFAGFFFTSQPAGGAVNRSHPFFANWLLQLFFRLRRSGLLIHATYLPIFSATMERMKFHFVVIFEALGPVEAPDELRDNLKNALELKALDLRSKNLTVEVIQPAVPALAGPENPVICPLCQGHHWSGDCPHVERPKSAGSGYVVTAIESGGTVTGIEFPGPKSSPPTLTPFRYLWLVGPQYIVVPFVLGLVLAFGVCKLLIH